MSVLDTGWRGYIKKPNSSNQMLGCDALEKLLDGFQFSTVLDLGCGSGEQAKVLSNREKIVTTIDFASREDYVPDYVGDYLDIEFPYKFDVVWCCHVLEHVRNIEKFLGKIYSDLESEGILAMTVPPAKHNIVSGHVSIWNAGLLLYNLILSGFDCSQASVRTYGYNISVIVKKNSTRIPCGVTEISRLNNYFPIEAFQGFDGRVVEVNW